MIKHLYLAIVAALKEVKDDNNNQYFKSFDLWNQNVEFMEEDEPFDRPAVFIEFDPINWQALGGKNQEAVATVRLHIVTDWHANTADNVASEYRTQALAYLDAPSYVLKAMQGLVIQPTAAMRCSNTWTRTQSIVNHNHERYVDSVEVYTTHIFDDSAANRNTGRILRVSVDAKLKDPL